MLRPGGGLALIWNRRPHEHELHAAINEIIEPHRGETPSHLAGAWRAILDETELFAPDDQLVIPFEQVLDLDQFVDRIGSISFIAALDEEPRAEVLRRVRALGASRPQPIHLAYTCEVHAFRRV